MTEIENKRIVHLNGEIDMDVADKARNTILPLIEAGHEVNINLSKVLYMDSSGISVLIESKKLSEKKNTKFELVDISKPVEKVLAMARKVFMSYKVTEEGNVATIHLDGEIDMDVTEKAKEVIFPHIEAGKEVHLNLSNVQYMDSSGISVLIESHQKALEKSTKVIIKDVSKSVLKVIMMAKLEQILNLE